MVFASQEFLLCSGSKVFLIMNCEEPCCLSPVVGHDSNLKKAAPLTSTLFGDWHGVRCSVLSVLLLFLNLCCSSVLLLFLVLLALLVVCLVVARFLVMDVVPVLRARGQLLLLLMLLLLVQFLLRLLLFLWLLLSYLADVSSGGNTLLIYFKVNIKSKTFLKDFPLPNLSATISCSISMFLKIL